MTSLQARGVELPPSTPDDSPRRNIRKTHSARKQNRHSPNAEKDRGYFSPGFEISHPVEDEIRSASIPQKRRLPTDPLLLTRLGGSLGEKGRSLPCASGPLVTDELTAIPDDIESDGTTNDNRESLNTKSEKSSKKRDESKLQVHFDVPDDNCFRMPPKARKMFRPVKVRPGDGFSSVAASQRVRYSIRTVQTPEVSKAITGSNFRTLSFTRTSRPSAVNSKNCQAAPLRTQIDLDSETENLELPGSSKHPLVRNSIAFSSPLDNADSDEHGRRGKQVNLKLLYSEDEASQLTH